MAQGHSRQVQVLPTGAILPGVNKYVLEKALLTPSGTRLGVGPGEGRHMHNRS